MMQSEHVDAKKIMFSLNVNGTAVSTRTVMMIQP